MNTKDKEAKLACIEWLNTSLRLRDSKKQWIFITLTMKQAVRYKNGNYEYLTEDKANQNAQWFAHALNKRIYKSRYKRGKAKLKLVDFAEGGNTERRHRHMLIEIPECSSFGEISYYAEKIWGGSRFGYRYNDYQIANKPEKIISYGLKTGAEALNLNNLSF